MNLKQHYRLVIATILCLVVSQLLVAPVTTFAQDNNADAAAQVLTLVTRHATGGGYDEAPVHEVRFVPLLGEHGFAGDPA